MTKGEQMIKLDCAVIVEGKYDKIKLSNVIDALIIETDGFAIFKDKEKQRFIRKLAQTKGILILTDSDSAGFKIRSFIGGSLPQDRVKHAYIPDVFGKEKRKTEMSKEGKLGVEGIKTELIIEALKKSGVVFSTCDKSSLDKRLITNSDLYEYGISGRPNSRALKKELLLILGLPERLSTSSLVKLLNGFVDYEGFVAAAEQAQTNLIKRQGDSL